MPNLLDEYNTITDYSKLSRENLEAKAKLLDAIELNLAACKINHMPVEHAKTGYMEGSKLRSPDGNLWVVRDGRLENANV